MNELRQLVEQLRQPEYVHVLLNPIPVYVLAAGAVALVIAWLQCSRPAQVLALWLIVGACVAVWPVIGSGQRAEHRVRAMSPRDAQQWLEVHEDRAEDLQYLFYLTGAVALAAIVTPRFAPRATSGLLCATLALTLASLVAGGWIGHAGGKVRHGEFRDGPPPAEARE